MAYIYDLTDTWNAGATTFNGIKMNVTDTASSASSRLVTLQVSGTEHFSVTKGGVGYLSGNLGIGTGSPGAKLDVLGNIRLSGANPNIEFNNGGGMVYGPAASTLAFATGGGPGAPIERMRLDSVGNFGINTASPTGKLDVRGAVSIGGSADASLHISTVYGGNGRLTQMGPSGTSANAFNIMAAKDGSGSELWYSWGVDTSDQWRINKGIGFAATGMVLGNGYAWWFTTSTLDTVSFLPFQVKGGISVDTNTTSGASAMSFFNGQGSNTRVGWIGTSGSSTSFNTSSDERLKDNIADADDAASIIDTIQVRQFDWKVNNEHQRYGVIAQELDAVFPEAVAHGPTEDDMLAVDYSKFVPMLLKEIQSLRARVANLEL